MRATGAQVVLSSTWRKHDDWLDYGPALDLPIIDRTPQGMGPRGQEIADWLAGHPEVERYAIIDDDADMLPEQMPYFVQTRYGDGFSWSNAQQLATLMGISIFDVNHPGQRLPTPTQTLDWAAP